MRGAKFLLAALALGCAPQSFASSNHGPSPNWSMATAIPDDARQQTNILRLDGDRFLWNGREVAEASVRAFLDVTATMNPQPLLVLTHSARTPSERVRRARLLVDEAVRCTPAKCLEVTASPQ
jgi:hypothetical protein